MPRLDPLPPEPQDPVTAEVFETFAREGRAPILLYRLLAHNPPLLRSYATLARGLRYGARTPRPLRELVILRIAQLTGSDYEWSHHRKMAEAAGVPEEQVRALADWRAAGCFDATERAALRCAEEIHAIELSDDAFAELRAQLPDDEALEIAVLAAFYEMVARIIQATGVEVEPEYAPYLKP